MPAQALTTEFLATLPGREPASGAVSYFDTEIKGFLLEHRASGGATFYFRYRDAAGKVRLNRIGRADEISVSDARAKAHKMKQMVTEGGDPKLESHRFKDVVIARVSTLGVRGVQIHEVVCNIRNVEHITHASLNTHSSFFEITATHGNLVLRLACPFGEEAAKSARNVGNAVQCTKEIGNQ